FQTATLTHSDIKNHSQYKGESFGLGASASISGKTLGQGAQNKPQNKHLTSVADKNGASSSVGYGSDSDSQSSITKSGINTRNIQITDEAGQIRLTGKTAEESKADIYTNTTTDTAEQHSGSLNNVFDKEKVQNELDLQRTVSQKFSQNVQQANTEINKHLDDLKDQLDKGEISQTEYDNKVKNWQQGQVLLNSIAAGLAAPTQSATGIIAATASPALSYKIGQEFKNLANQNADGKLTASQETAHILAHAVLGAAVAAAGDNNALAGAISAGGAEAAAPVISNWLYGEADSSKLTAEQKETVTGITNLLGTATGAAVGNTTANAVQGSLNADSAVESNYLTEVSLEKLQTGQLTMQEAEKLSQFLDTEVNKLCSIDPISDACRTGISNQIKYIAMREAWEIMHNDVSRTSHQTFNYLYNSPNAHSRFVVYFNNIDARANFFGASNQYEKNLGVGVRWFSGAEKVSRACLTGLGADGCVSYLTFGAGKLLGNPDLYGWRKEAGDTLMNKGFSSFRDLYKNKPNMMRWDIKQLRDEQTLLQPIHEKYLANHSFFRLVSEKITHVDILDYKSRIQYGCKLLGYTAQQGCKP
ncbi:TPA: VENN motif pre-toxin domain-containing protein, partial [Neisseria lactamica]